MSASQKRVSEKHRNFVTAPMRGKRIDDLAGVGQVLGGRLREKGYDQPSKVLGQYLATGRNPEKFESWMKETVKANSGQARNTSQCLQEWCDNHL